MKSLVKTVVVVWLAVALTGCGQHSERDGDAGSTGNLAGAGGASGGGPGAAGSSAAAMLAGQGPWRELRCKEGGFSVEFPGQPEPAPEELSGGGPLFSLELENAEYLAGCSEVVKTDLPPEEIIEQTLAATFDPTHRILDQRPLSLEGKYPGKSLVVADSEGDVFVVRTYMARNRLYQTMVVTSAERKDAPETLRFHDSFRLLDPVPELLSELKSPQPGRRKEAANRLADLVPTESQREEVAQALVPLLSDADEFTRASGLRGLAVWHTPETVPEIIKCLEDPDFGVRWAALDALGKVADAQAAEAVASQLAGRDCGPAAAVLKAMGPAAEKAVARRFSHADVAVRREALEVVKEIGTKRIVPELLGALSDRDNDVRRAALEILGNLKDEQAVVAVAELLEVDGDRGKAADCLKRMGRMVEETVLQGLQHPDPKVVSACCEVLAEVGSEKCLAELERLTDHRDWSIRGAAKQAGRTIVAQRPR